MQYNLTKNVVILEGGHKTFDIIFIANLYNWFYGPNTILRVLISEISSS